MTLPAWLRELLPGDTAPSWEAIRDLVPASAYLAGGTALAVHLRHRQSRDLDFFLERPEDLLALRDALSARGTFAVTQASTDTLNGQFHATKVQFLEAATQRNLEPPRQVEGLRVAGLRDLLAMKLKVVGDRGELRDYYDLEKIEQAGLTVEEGLGLFLARYSPQDRQGAVLHVVRALGSFDDVADDPFLPEDKDRISSYWQARQPHVLRALRRLRAPPSASPGVSPP